VWKTVTPHKSAEDSREHRGVTAASDPPTVDDPVSALDVDFSHTARILFAAGDVDDTLGRLLVLAKATIEGCDHAGVVLVEGDTMVTPAHTDPVVADLDALQHRYSQGPTLDAIAHQLTFYAADLAEESRWPLFGPAAADHGIRSVLALPLFADGTLGSLNLYARYPHAFGVIDRARGLLLAALAAMAFTSARSHDAGERREANLHAALATREVIGQAQGILIERERITADQAFDILRRASQHLNLKVRDIAQTLVDTGEDPDTGPSRSPSTSSVPPDRRSSGSAGGSASSSGRWLAGPVRPRGDPAA
jgi:GAF domain-containing protein